MDTRQGPVAALVLDVTNPLDGKRERLLKWTRIGRQAVCVLCVTPDRGAADLTSWASGTGYRYVMHGTSIGEYCDDLEAHLKHLVERRVWLCPEVAKALACFEPAVVESLSVAAMLIPEHTTVACWVKELGMERRQELEDVFARLGLPGPKIVLDWLRLLRVVDYATGLERKVDRECLARRFSYPGGKYLGRRAKDLTGQPLGQLLEAGVEGTLRALRASF